MTPQDVLLHRWTLSVDGAGDRADSFRAMEAVITREVGAALRDPVVREHVSGLLIHKRCEREESEVGFVIIAPPEVADTLGMAVSRHLESREWRHTVSDTDPILHPAFAEYIRGLREQTEIALDLHCVPQAELRQHQCFLIRVCCASADPRYQLHPYLVRHSRAYVRPRAVLGTLLYARTIPPASRAAALTLEHRLGHDTSAMG